MQWFANFVAEKLVGFLQWTAWPMSIWQVYGPQHIFVGVFGISTAVLAAVWMAKKCAGHWKKVFIAVGMVLLFSELYKQLFYFYVVNQGQYKWHLLPFQLCSLPMYLCLWIPWIKSRKLKMILNTFMADFNVLGAVMVFVDPTGLFHGYVTLTAHGVVWHLLILFVGIYSGLSGLGAHKNLFTQEAYSDLYGLGAHSNLFGQNAYGNSSGGSIHRSVSGFGIYKSMMGFLYGLPVYAATSALAVVFNILLHPYGNANLFYLNPYEASIQIVFSDIAARFGVTVGNVAYYLATIVGAYIVHICLCGLVEYCRKR